jgi:hypothetical protein
MYTTKYFNELKSGVSDLSAISWREQVNFQ